MKPLNRHLLISPIEAKREKEESVIVLPTDYEKPVSPYVVAELLDFAPDCQKDHTVGSIVVLERRMLNTLEIDGETYYLVLEKLSIWETRFMKKLDAKKLKSMVSEAINKQSESMLLEEPTIDEMATAGSVSSRINVPDGYKIQRPRQNSRGFIFISADERKRQNVKA